MEILAEYLVVKGNKMTEKRKKELRYLLNTAIASLEIRSRRGNHSPLSVTTYGKYLQTYWASYLPDLESLVQDYEFHFVNKFTKSELLDFIRAEFASFIHEDRIQSASSLAGPHPLDGWSLDFLLDQLLKIAIGRGIEVAILDFDRCTQNAPGSFQCIVLLSGIEVETEIQVFEGMRVVPISKSTRPEYLHGLDFIKRHPRMSTDNFSGNTLLVTDCFVSPRLHKPIQATNHEYSCQKSRIFRIGVNGKIFPKTNSEEFYTYMEEFYAKFCQALSLACNSPIQIVMKWRFMAANQLFNLNMGSKGATLNPVVLANFLLGSWIKIGEFQINEAKHLYYILINLDSGALKKLQIPIDRWMKSKVSRNQVDKIIDLGIAFEALYLSDISEATELSFRLRLRAAWLLGKDQVHRQELMKDFSKIYEWRSKAVHTGRLPNKTKKTSFAPEEVEAFITKAQDLCRDSIMKILKDEKFPDWNDLILG